MEICYRDKIRWSDYPRNAIQSMNLRFEKDDFRQC
eukprot:gene11332-4144_t